MPGSSILRKLSDADIEALHHMLRRDDQSDADIARWVKEKLGKIAAKDMPESEHAWQNVISRYRKSGYYLSWLDRWENQDKELRTNIELQKHRFEYLSGLVRGADEKGLYAASNHLKARLLTIAAEMTDEELKTGDVKWIKGLLQEIRDAEKLERQSLGTKAAELAGDTKLSAEERAKRVREIFA